MLRGLIKTLRPKQWVKNFFVAAPLLFAMKLGELDSVLRVVAGFLLFSLISGCVYVINDLVDIEKDRAHPKKRHRPIPSGQLPPVVATRFVLVAVPVAVGLGAVLSPAFTGVMAAYFGLNLAYSFWLKKIAYLDVTIIATGFVFRVLAGSFVIDVTPSAWLLGCTATLAMFLGFGKRAHELLTAGDSASKQRAVLERYNESALKWLLHSLAVITITLYALYTQSPSVQAVTAGRPMIYTVPFPLIGILRFIYLVTHRPESESPTEEMLKDPIFIINVIAFCGVTGAVLYGLLG